KRFWVALAQDVNELRNSLLSGSGLAKNEHRHLRLSEQRRGFQNPHKCRMVTDDAKPSNHIGGFRIWAFLGIEARPSLRTYGRKLRSGEVSLRPLWLFRRDESRRTHLQEARRNLATRR